MTRTDPTTPGTSTVLGTMATRATTAAAYGFAMLGFLASGLPVKRPTLQDI